MSQPELAKTFLKFKELFSFQQFMGMDDTFYDDGTGRISAPTAPLLG
jgi:hypothetical protein